MAFRSPGRRSSGTSSNAAARITSNRPGGLGGYRPPLFLIPPRRGGRFAALGRGIAGSRSPEAWEAMPLSKTARPQLHPFAGWHARRCTSGCRLDYTPRPPLPSGDRGSAPQAGSSRAQHLPANSRVAVEQSVDHDRRLPRRRRSTRPADAMREGPVTAPGAGSPRVSLRAAFSRRRAWYRSALMVPSGLPVIAAICRTSKPA